MSRRKKKRNAVRLAAIVCAAVVLLTLYLHIGAQLSVTLTQVTVTPASEKADTFETLRGAILTGDLENAYTQSVSSDPEEYVFVTYTALARNFGLLPAEWVLLGVAHADSDVALLTGTEQDVAPFSSSAITCVLLTTRDAAQENRLAWADYYVWGRPFSAAVNGGAAR